MTQTSTSRSLLLGSLRALGAGAAGGALAALVVMVALQLQGRIWGHAVLQGLPSSQGLSWCLLWSGGIGLLIAGYFLHFLPSAWQAKGLNWLETQPAGLLMLVWMAGVGVSTLWPMAAARPFIYWKF